MELMEKEVQEWQEQGEYQDKVSMKERLVQMANKKRKKAITFS